MSDHVTLAEAATYLGISKATLRNWDKSGKLKAVRHPLNDYRVYNLNDLKEIRNQTSIFDDESRNPTTSTRVAQLTPREVKALISRLHNVIRDTDANSSLIARFDELTKMLFLAMQASNFKDIKAKLLATSEPKEVYASGLRKAYAELCETLPFTTPPLFKAFNCSDHALYECGKVLSFVDLSNATLDIKGLAYEEMIKKTFDKTDNQQFFTPPQIVKFMVDFYGSNLAGRICDPASGTGGFLVEVAKRNIQGTELTGFEIDERLAWVTGINAYINGAKDVNSTFLSDGGTLGKHALRYFGTFDFIITNPPFGSDFSDTEQLRCYKLGNEKSSRRRGILFIERCLNLLADNGCMALIIDEGVLNLPHAQDVRHFILDNFDIEGIISLPESAFMPYASVNASILFLKKKLDQNNISKTFFARSNQIGRKANGDDDIIYNVDGSSQLASDLPTILQGWNKGPSHTNDQELFYWSSVSDYANEENGYRLDFRFHHPSRSISYERLTASAYRLMTIGDLCYERKDTLIPSKELADSVIAYTGLAHIESHTGLAAQSATPTNSLKSAVKRYESGDILFARMRPNLRKVALMDFPDGGFTSPECIVLSPKKNNTGDYIIRPLLMSVLLRSDLVQGQIAHLTAGIGRPRLNTKDLRKVQIPIPPISEQETIEAAYLAELESAKLIRAQASRLVSDAANLETKAVRKLAESMSGVEQKDE